MTFSSRDRSSADKHVANDRSHGSVYLNESDGLSTARVYADSEEFNDVIDD